MYSSKASASLYVVQVRFRDSYREQVGSCEFGDFISAKGCAVRLDRWLKQGHAYDLSEEAIDLPGDLDAMGIDPAACVVEVVLLPSTGPGRYDTLGTVLCVASCVPDDERDDDADVILESTPLERDACALTAVVMVAATAR